MADYAGMSPIGFHFSLAEKERRARNQWVGHAVYTDIYKKGQILRNSIAEQSSMSRSVVYISVHARARTPIRSPARRNSVSVNLLHGRLELHAFRDVPIVRYPVIRQIVRSRQPWSNVASSGQHALGLLNICGIEVQDRC